MTSHTIILVTFVLCFTTLLNIVTAYDYAMQQEWINFKLQYNKEYDSRRMENYRYRIFANNKLKIANHNELYKQGLVTYDMKMNKHGDMDPRDFERYMTGLNMLQYQTLERKISRYMSPAITPFTNYPTEVDWRRRGAVTKVQNQGQCGSCWAFSANGALEGQYFLHTGKLVNLSEQHLIDCSTAYGNRGCSGGLPASAYSYIKSNGIALEYDYTYEGTQKSCRYQPFYSITTVRDHIQIDESEEELKIAVANIGPISVGVATPFNLRFYNSGVYYDNECSHRRLSHAVLVVGYGSDPKNGDFWLIKNSWGTSWGMDGYVKLARNKGNHCGIASLATYPVL